MSDAVIVRHCSPTLAGMKTGSLFSVEYEDQRRLYEEIRRLNRRLRDKGLCVLPMRCAARRALIYLYRPGLLARDLSDAQARSILARRGYDCGSPERCVARLARRLREEGEFPHEVGLFLSYPPEDVRGFVENRAENYKCVGCWKVYGDAERARRQFERYRRCTGSLCSRHADGTPIEQLTVPT